MIILGILFIGSIIGFGSFLWFKPMRLKVTSFFVIASFLIAIIFLMLSGNVNTRNGSFFKSSRGEKVVGLEEKTKSETISFVKIKEKVLLDAPVFKQYPELPRGCEVTSLAMLLQYSGVPVEKMELAENVRKDSTPLNKQNGAVFWGDPNEGRIKSMRC